MPVISGKGSEFSWVVTPIRVKFPRRRVHQELKRYCAENSVHRLNVITGKEVRAAFVNTKELTQDFAQTLLDKVKAKNYLYIEARKEDFILVRSQNKEIQEDRLLRTKADLVGAIIAIAKAQEYRKVEAFKVETYGLSLDGELKAALDRLKTQKVTGLNQPYTESLEYKEEFIFQSIEDSLKSLTDSKLQAFFVTGIIMCALAWFITAEYTPKPLTERIKKTNPYEAYVNKMLSKPAASTRLAQDLVVQLRLREELIGWHMYRVEHIPEGILYTIKPDRMMRPTYASLVEYTNQSNFELINKDGVIQLLAPGRIDTPYQSKDDVRIISLEQLVGNITDNTHSNTPFVSVVTGARDTKELWQEQIVTFELRNAGKHDLMRLAAIIDGQTDPVSGETIHYPVTIFGAQYEVDAVGKYNGNIQVKVFGDKV